MAFQTVN